MLYLCTDINLVMKPRNPSSQSTRLLDQLPERIRYLHYSLSTEKVYLYWVRFFMRSHGIGIPEMVAFLTMPTRTCTPLSQARTGLMNVMLPRRRTTQAPVLGRLLRRHAVAGGVAAADPMWASTDA
jgi:hypothetical protein